MAVSLADLGKANELALEKANIDRVIMYFDTGGAILKMLVGASRTDNFGVAVDTSYIEYPPQMITAIKQALQQHRIEIDKALTDMGIDTSVGK